MARKGNKYKYKYNYKCIVKDSKVVPLIHYFLYRYTENAEFLNRASNFEYKNIR